MPKPSDALRKQLESDAGPHATPDQQRAAEKRRAAVERADAPSGRASRKPQQTG
jgi:hypothetical protein